MIKINFHSTIYKFVQRYENTSILVYQERVRFGRKQEFNTVASTRGFSAITITSYRNEPVQLCITNTRLLYCVCMYNTVGYYDYPTLSSIYPNNDALVVVGNLILSRIDHGSSSGIDGNLPTDFGELPPTCVCLLNFENVCG